MKRATRYLFLLLVAATAQKVVENISNGELKRQLSQIENEQLFDNFRMKSMMDRIMQSVEANKKQMEDLAMQGQSTKDCQKALAAWSLIDASNTKMFFKALGKTFYYSLTKEGTWAETRDWCNSTGTQMVILKTADALNQLEKILRSKTAGSNFWVSASDIGRSPSGQFHWADGTPVLKSTWARGEPNDAKLYRQACAYIHTGSEKMFDAPCSGKLFTLCEVPELLANCI